jgi:ribonucleoside-diphosphate reductase alpha chain
LEGIGGGRSVGFGPNRVLSVPDAIGKALRELLEVRNNNNGTMEICPECGQAALIFVEGCAKCQYCGHSEC